MKTTYTIPTSTDYYGGDVTPEQALKAAQWLRDELQARFSDVEFQLVPERQSWGNRASGNEEIIEAIKAYEELILVDAPDY